MVGSTHWVQKCPMKITNLSEQKSPNKKASHHFWNSISMLILYVSGEWCCTFNLLNVWVLILYVFWWMMLHLYLRWWCLLYHLCSVLYSFLTDNIAEIELGHKNYTRGWAEYFLLLNRNNVFPSLFEKMIYTSQWEFPPLLFEAKRFTFICVSMGIISEWYFSFVNWGEEMNIYLCHVVNHICVSLWIIFVSQWKSHCSLRE